jgi:predicted permease
LNRTQRAEFYRRLEDSILTVPGVESAGVTDCLPLGRNRSWSVRAVGVSYEQGQIPLGFPRIVDAGYIPAMKIPLRRGRLFTEHDGPNSENAVVINETLAKRLWPDRDAVGQQVQVFGREPFRVIGVVANVRHSSLEEEGSSEFYLLISQTISSSSVDLVVRTKVAPESLASGVRAAIAKVDPSIPTAEYRTLDGVVERAVSPRKFIVLLLGGFAALALVLAALGIYGVVSYSVAQRTQEIGIRMALGASAGAVQLGVLRQTLGLALAGGLIGTAASAAVARLMESLLYGVQPGDIATFGGMVVVLALVAAIAGYLPALRASRIDPMSALRAE